MDKLKRAYLETHVAVLLFGLTAVLGKLITLVAFMLVWWRVLITSISLLALKEIRTDYKSLSNISSLKFLSIGAIVGLHWVCFYASIKYANASIALVCFAMTAFFTAILNPIFFKTKLNKLELLFGILIILGMVLIANNIDLSLMFGFWLGILSAFLASIFTILNKKYINEANPLLITFLEMFGAWLFLTVCLPIYIFVFDGIFSIPKNMDIIYILLLSIFCTTIAYGLSVKALKWIGTFESNLIYNMEPIYGIVLAALVLNEHEELTFKFYLGVMIILTLVFAHPFIVKKYNTNGV